MQQFLERCPDEVMDKESMLMVITFHSLEERLVAQSMEKWRKQRLGQLGTKKPLLPSSEEIDENSRSKSAKLYSFLFN